MTMYVDMELYCYKKPGAISSAALMSGGEVTRSWEWTGRSFKLHLSEKLWWIYI